MFKMFKAIMEVKFETACRFMLYWYVMLLMFCMGVELLFPMGQKLVLLTSLCLGAVTAGLLIRWVIRCEEKKGTTEDK